jgi:hypothetical protein
VTSIQENSGTFEVLKEGPVAYAVKFPNGENNRLFLAVKQAIAYNAGHMSGQTTDFTYRMPLLIKMREHYDYQFSRYLSDPLPKSAIDFLAFIDAEIEDAEKTGRQRIANGEALFEDMEYVFEKDTQVYVGAGSEMRAGIVSSIEYKETMMGTFWLVSIDTISNRSGKVKTDTIKASIGAFSGIVKFDTLPIKLMNDEVKAKLTERGETFRKYSTGYHHVSYVGNIVQESWWSERSYRSTGRVIVDIDALRVVDPNLFGIISSSNRYSDDDEDEASALNSIADVDLWRTSPYLYGFSFSAKAWGRLLVTGLSEIQWRDDSFDKLVLPTEEKEMVRALVEHNSGTFTDIVDGKGGGCIFLLHGPPGQGKTLTAETVAELLHKPLYMISVGELGTNPDQLEERLRTILDIATLWDAVLLLDEADIFLEARNETDIVRNAMVGVFLRLLEYHQGTLFLTTNRVRNIDTAFLSRISVALKFSESDHQKREKIWTNLLSSASLTGNADASRLAVHDINGRQIKTAIRLAQTLARSKGEVVTHQLIERTIKLGARFDA